jgi:hypothetical protein
MQQTFSLSISALDANEAKLSVRGGIAALICFHLCKI